MVYLCPYIKRFYRVFKISETQQSMESKMFSISLNEGSVPDFLTLCAMPHALCFMNSSTALFHASRKSRERKFFRNFTPCTLLLTPNVRRLKLNPMNPTNSINPSNLSREMRLAPWNVNTIPLGPALGSVGTTTSGGLFHRDPINPSNAMRSALLVLRSRSAKDGCPMRGTR
jgi:hypothetical protein